MYADGAPPAQTYAASTRPYMIRYLIILLLVLFAAVLIVSQPRAAVSIVGIDCQRYVAIPGEPYTIVCVTDIATATAGLLRIGDQAQFLREAYEVLLLRRIDGPGYGYWTGELNAGRISREGVLRAIISSGEFRALGR